MGLLVTRAQLALTRLLAEFERAGVPKSKRRGRVALALGVSRDRVSAWERGYSCPLCHELALENMATLAEFGDVDALAKP